MMYDGGPAYKGCVELTLGIKGEGIMTQRMALVTGASSEIGRAQYPAEEGLTCW